MAKVPQAVSKSATRPTSDDLLEDRCDALCESPYGKFTAERRPGQRETTAVREHGCSACHYTQVQIEKPKGIPLVTASEKGRAQR